MDFEDQLKKAIERGQQRGSAKRATEKAASLSAEDIRNRHNNFRLELSEHIESAMRKLENMFPGFEFEIIYGQKGWGGGISRDDLAKGESGGVSKFYSRLEIMVRPQNEFNVVNIAGKGTVKNKEMFNWNHFIEVADAKMDEFKKRIDQWILQYAENFAAH